MKSKLIKSTVILLSMLILFTGCTSVGAASSWPGFTVDESTGYLSINSQTLALNLSNGELLWRYPSEATNSRQAYAAPIPGEGMVVVGDYNGVLAALNQDSGALLWEFDGAVDRYISSVLISDGIVYAPNSDHYLYAVSSNGDLEWKYKTTGPNWSTPVADENYVFLASMDHTLYALRKEVSTSELDQAEDGTKTLVSNAQWSTDLGMAIVGEPVLVDGVIYATTIKGQVFAIDASNGKVIWSFDDSENLNAVWGIPVLTENTVFIADVEGNIYALQKEDGSPLWPSPFSAGGKVIGGGVALDGNAVFATDGGKIFMINSAKESKTIANVEYPINTSLGISGENIIFAPFGSEDILTAVDMNGFEVWSFTLAD